MVCHVRCVRIVRSAVLLSLMCGACAAQTSDDLGVSESALRRPSPCPSDCVPVDSADTVPDRIDEDCDGEIDEDVEASRANCPRGVRVIEGTRGDDVLHGTHGRDCILGYGGNDTIFGESGDDVIFGGPGDDVIFPGTGQAIVRAGSGDDRVETRGAFASTVYGEDGADTLLGGAGADRFFGGADNDVLEGGGGRDMLWGGGCHDRIVGGRSVDIVNGGEDIDSCESALSFECELGRRRVDCRSDSDCPAGERCTVHTGFCVPNGAAACGGGQNGCTASGPDDDCDAVDDDCDGRVDEGFSAVATSCGTGACASSGTTACAGGSVTDTCRPSPPSAQTDTSCDGRDDDCDGASDEEFAPYDTVCGYGLCTREGSATCQAGQVVDSCRIACEGRCDDGAEDDGDGQIDCDDPDCATAQGCALGGFGSPCTADAQCDHVGGQGFCITTIPGGYCSRLCGSGCPSGAYCIVGSVCVLECGPGDHCGRAGYSCGPVDVAGLPPEPWCHPTCEFSCPFGFSCNADSATCEIDLSP